MLCFLLFLLLSTLSPLSAQSNAFPTSYTLYTDSVLSTGDWSPVLAHIGDKRMVLIGEFTHGASQIFRLRNELIKFLHQKRGFDLVLFESGIGELIYPNFFRGQLSATEMTSGLFGSWRTREFRKLMAYIQTEGLEVAGFDVQRTGRSFEALLNNAGHNGQLDSTLYADLEVRFGTLRRKLPNRNTEYDSVAVPTVKLIEDYDDLLRKMEISGVNDQLPYFPFIIQTLKNRVSYLDFMLQFVRDKDWRKRWASRDSLMASNVRWLAREVYKDRKLIIVAHNFHIAKFNEKEEVMGEYLQPDFGPEMYSIGLFAGAGSYLDNYGREEAMTPPASLRRDIKQFIAPLPEFAHFIPLSAPDRPPSLWLDQPIVINDSFIDLNGSNELVLSQHFDALILLKRVSPPDK